MIINIGSLRQAVKSVLPLVGESHRGNGLGVFLKIDKSIWCVSGSFQTKVGGARICGLEDGWEEVVNKFINLRDLHQFLTISFTSEHVDISSTTASLKFAVGIDKMLFRFVADDSFVNFISFPSMSDCVVIDNFPSLSICHAAQGDGGMFDQKLSSVYVDIASDVQMFATDGYVIGYSKIANENHPPAKCLVSANFLLYAIRLYWESSPMLRLIDNRAWLFSDDFFVFGAVTADAASYPGGRIFEAITAETSSEAKIDTVSLLDRLNAFLNVDYRGKNQQYAISAIEFDFDDDKETLVLSAGSQDGWVTEGAVHIPFSGHANKWKVNIHAVKKVGNVIKNILSSSYLKFSTHDEGWMIIRPDDNDDIIFGIIPMKF